MIYQSNAFKFGIGLFETIRVTDGKPEYMDEHFTRLKSSLNALKLELKLEYDAFHDEVMKQIKECELSEFALRIQLSDCGLTTSIRQLSYSDEHYNFGLKIGISQSRVHSSSLLLYHKTSNYMENMLIQKFGANNGYDEMLRLNENGDVTEGTKSNIFIVKDNKVITPDVKSGLLCGIMRNKVMEMLRVEGVDVSEAFLSLEDLESADALFLTNSLMGVMPIAEMTEMKFDVSNQILRKLVSIFRKR